MNIAHFFNQNRPVFSLEIFPPKKTTGIESIYRTIDELSSLKPDFISVTYGAGGNTADNSTCEIAGFIKKKYQIEPLAHLTCVHLSKKEAQHILKGFLDHDIENVLALRGDIKPDFEPKKDFKYASELIAEILKHSQLNIAAACYPEGHFEAASIEEDIQHLKSKVDSGAGVLITQLFFDNNLFYQFKDKVRRAGIQVPISAGIMPIVSKLQIEKTVALSGASLPHAFATMVSKYGEDPEALFEAGINYAADQINDLLDHEVEGIHLYTMNNPKVAKCVYEKIRAKLQVS